MTKTTLFLFTAGILLLACQHRKKADTIFYNGIVYTVDSAFSAKQAFAVAQGRIIATGSDNEILNGFEGEKIDLGKSYVYPGFIDAHCHFYNYGMNLQTVDLTGTTSFQEVIQKVKAYANDHQTGWIVGRGWDQNDWEIKQFPEKRAFDSLFPSRPLILKRVDGHAALVNQAALNIAGIDEKTKIAGGEIFKEKNHVTGILIDNAVELVEKKIPPPDIFQMEQGLLAAQANCFGVGLTTVDDAGLEKNVVQLIDSLQRSGKLKMRIYAMLSPTKDNLSTYLTKGPVIKDLLNISSVKIYADGALGSRGACLTMPYSDKPSHTGFLLKPIHYFDSIATVIYKAGFQMNTHCIGDSANRLILDVYGKTLKGKNDRRWRIEHCQVVQTSDVPKFGQFSIIPSIQTTHATSDMYWAGDRLGKRISTAYAYKSLLKQNGLIANGSDFPVEDINPLFGFYAAVVRKDKKGFPKNGFQVENALSRKEALYAMTYWAAYANGEEKQKGSIEKNKFADFVILEQDLLKTPDSLLWKIKVKQTWIAGKKRFDRDSKN